MAQKILALFPERHLLRLIQVNMERQGFEVYLAETIEEATVLAQQHKPNMLIIDEDLEVDQIASEIRGIEGCENAELVRFQRP
jgi:DNA-binding response OmpR family regulator